MMPKRRRTRAADRAQRIKRERALNAAYAAQFAKATEAAATAVKQRNKPPPTQATHIGNVNTSTSDDDLPPF